MGVVLLWGISNGLGMFPGKMSYERVSVFCKNGRFEALDKE